MNESLDRLAVVARGLGDDRWHDELVAAGATGVPAAPAPTYEAVARAGIAVVGELVDGDRWDEAAAAAARLTALFRRDRHRLHPVAAESFDGLHAAVSEGDRDGVDDFLSLLEELFGGGADG